MSRISDDSADRYYNGFSILERYITNTIINIAYDQYIFSRRNGIDLDMDHLAEHLNRRIFGLHGETIFSLEIIFDGTIWPPYDLNASKNVIQVKFVIWEPYISTVNIDFRKKQSEYIEAEFKKYYEM